MMALVRHTTALVRHTMEQVRRRLELDRNRKKISCSHRTASRAVRHLLNIHRSYGHSSMFHSHSSHSLLELRRPKQQTVHNNRRYHHNFRTGLRPRC